MIESPTASTSTANYRLAFIHEWLITLGGGEQVLKDLLQVWPDATIYTLMADLNGPCSSIVNGRRVETSFLQKWYAGKRNHRTFLPFMPMAVEQFDLRSWDVIISNSHTVAHGIIPQPYQLHINYILSPVRYAWHLYHEYLEESGLERGLKSWLARFILHYLRQWDASTAQRIDHYIAISQWVRENVWRVYRRKAEVIYPPVDVERFFVRPDKQDFYLTVSRFVPYKRLDLIVEAFTAMPDKKLVVIGDGPDFKKVQAKAGPNIRLMGFQSQDVVVDTMQRSRAFIFAALEDFGIVPVEAQACGTPVIAFGKGGARETILEGQTGLFFDHQTPQSLIEAVHRFEQIESDFKPEAMRKNAERFSRERFRQEMMSTVERLWNEFQAEKRISGI